MLVMRWLMSPPVQLSANASVHLCPERIFPIRASRLSASAVWSRVFGVFPEESNSFQMGTRRFWRIYSALAGVNQPF